jgi:hypothetical protein
LLAQLKATRDRSKALKAEKLLKASLTLARYLVGEANFARFNEL